MIPQGVDEQGADEQPHYYADCASNQILTGHNQKVFFQPATAFVHSIRQYR